MGNVVPASRIETFQVTVPANTPQTAPVTTPLTFRPGEVVHAEIEIPPGHNGLTGIQLGVRGGIQIPLTARTFLVGSGKTFEWNLTDQPNSGSWLATAYNTDVYEHAFYITFAVLDLSPDEPEPPLTPILV